MTAAAIETASTPPLVRLRPLPRPHPQQAGTDSLALARSAPSAPRPHPAVWEDDDPPAPAPDVGALPDPRRWSALLAQAVVEILGGRRPPGQVVRWTAPEIYDRIQRSAPRQRAGQSGTPVRVRRVRVSTSPEGSVEAVAIVDDGQRCRALAIRLEPLQRRWMCTALDLV